MPQFSYPYAAARVKCKENELINKDKFTRLASAKDADEVFRLLVDLGFATPEEATADAYEKCLGRMSKEMTHFIKEITPDERVTDTWFRRFDYHNLKAMVKTQAGSKGGAHTKMINAGLIEPSYLYECIHEKRYSDLPPEMKEGLETIDRRFSIKPDVTVIGLSLDKAYAKEIVRLIEGVKLPYIHMHYQTDFDFINIKNLIRIKRTNAGRDVLEAALLPGGSIPMYKFFDAYEGSQEDMLSEFERTNYGEVLRQAFEFYANTGSLNLLEKGRLDTLSNLARENRDDIFTASTVFAYLVAVLRQTQVLRMIIVGKLNHMDSSNLMQILPSIV